MNKQNLLYKRQKMKLLKQEKMSIRAQLQRSWNTFEPLPDDEMIYELQHASQHFLGSCNSSYHTEMSYVEMMITSSLLFLP